jgi:chromosomal replication initiation ATPase DnaA
MPTAAKATVDRSQLRVALEDTVAHVFEIDRSRLSQPTRGAATVAQARQVAMYLAHIGYGMTLTEVGQLFERDRTTVAHACHVIEDRRECPRFDRALDILESVARQLAQAAPEVV